MPGSPRRRGEFAYRAGAMQLAGDGVVGCWPPPSCRCRPHMPSRTPSAPPVWCRPALAKHRCSTTFSLFKIVIGTAVVLAPGNPLGGCFLYQFFGGNYGLIHPSNTGGRGVAFFAHVGGFIFGAVVAGFLSGRDASPSRRHDGPNVGPFVVTDLLCRCCPTMGNSAPRTSASRVMAGRIECPVGDDFRGTRI